MLNVLLQPVCDSRAPHIHTLSICGYHYTEVRPLYAVYNLDSAGLMILKHQYLLGFLAVIVDGHTGAKVQDMVYIPDRSDVPADGCAG